MHIFEGYKIALDNIDKVISIIRSSPNVEEAKINLINAFKTSDLIDKFNELGDYESASEGGLSDAQASAIVAMTLGRLSGLERDKIEARLADLAEIVKGLRYRCVFFVSDQFHGFLRHFVYADFFVIEYCGEKST